MSVEIPEFKFSLTKELDDSFLPTRAYDTDTGWDVRAAKEFIIKPFEYVKIPLGFRMFAPSGWWVELRPRSSSHAKKHLNCLYGVIDESWEGECCLSAQWIPAINPLPGNYISFINRLHDRFSEKLTISFGEKIGQIIPVHRKEMKVFKVSDEEFDELCKNRGQKRGTKGFGSTENLESGWLKRGLESAKKETSNWSAEKQEAVRGSAEFDLCKEK